jgi:hypothetical protein
MSSVFATIFSASSSHTALLLLAGVVILLGARPLRLVHLAVAVGKGGELLLPLVLAEHLAENRRVRALGDAVHAAGAVRRDVLRQLRGDVAEVAQRRRAGRDERPRQRQVGGEFLLAVPLLVAADDAVVEVGHVQHRQVERRPQPDRLVLAVGEGAVAVVVERVLVARRVHRRRRNGCGGHGGEFRCVGW